MRILITVDPEIPVPPVTYGGIERIVDWLSRGLENRGHVIGLVANAESTCKNNRNYAWPMKTSRLFPDGVLGLKKTRDYSRDFKPDVVNSFSRIFYMLGVIDFNYPLVMSYQRHPTKRTVTLAKRIFADRLTFTGCSEFIASMGRKYAGDWHCIYNGVEIEKYNFNTSVPEDAPLVFLSRIEPIKGAHLAIQIAKQSNKRLILAGNFPEAGEGYQYWTNIIKPNIDGDLIQYVGPVNDTEKNSLLSQALALLVPIQWDEPFGIVFAESLACGTPVISCPRGALPEIVSAGQNGFLINDLEQGIEAVRNISAIPRGNCRKIAEAKFSSDVLVGQYEKLYEDLLA